MGHLLKANKEFKKYKETGAIRYIYQNELDKACFQHDMAFGDFKDLPKRTAVDKILPNKIFNIAKNPKYDRYQRGLALMVFDKKTAGGAVKNDIMQNKELAEELHKPIIRKLEKQKVHSSFIDNIWGADLIKEFVFYCMFYYLYSKYAWVIPVKDKKAITITNAFQNFLNESGRKPNKI